MNSVMDAIAGGWQVNGINTFRTGLPSTATLSSGLATSTVNTGGASRPDQVASDRTAVRPANHLSVLQHRGLRGAAEQFVPLRQRRPQYGARAEPLQFRFLPVQEFQDPGADQAAVPRRVLQCVQPPNYGQPATQVGAATLGTITSLAANTTMRQSQLGMKLLF